MKKFIISTILLTTLSFVFACGDSQTDNAASNASRNSNSVVVHSNGFSSVDNQNNRQNAPTRTTIDEIYAAAANDKARFAELCSGKPIIVTGLFEVLKSDKDEQIVTLKSADSEQTLNAYVRVSESEGVFKMTKGQYVIAEGRCETQADSFVIKNSRIALFNVPPNQIEEKTNANQEKTNANQKKTKN